MKRYRWPVFWLLVILAGCGVGVQDDAIFGRNHYRNNGYWPTPTPLATATPTPTPVRSLDSTWISLAGLAAYYKLDEAGVTNGVTIADSAGNLRDGVMTTLDGSVKSSSGIVGTSIGFDGLDDRVVVPDFAASNFDFTNGDTITVSAWIFPAALPVGGGQIVTKGATAGTNNSNFSFQTSDGIGGAINKLSFAYFDGTTWNVFSSSSGVLVTGAWQHVAFKYTFGSPATASLYLNGGATAGSWVSGSGNNAPVITDEALWIGGSDDPGGAPVETPFNGLIDDISIWRRALSGTEVLDIFNRPTL